MKRLLFIILLSILALTIYYYSRHPLGQKVIINGHTIQVELAITDAEKEKGLGGRENLAENRGMLFVYDHEEQYRFWMRGMQFPLDFIWLKQKTVVDLHSSVPHPQTPFTQPAQVVPQVAVDKVLEVRAGTIDAFDIKVGDAVIFTD